MNSNETNNLTVHNKKKSSSEDFKKVILPIDGEILSDYNGDVLVIGRGAAKIDRDLEAHELKFPDAVTEFISKDGGLTVRPLEKNNLDSLKYPNDLCSAEKAVVIKNTLYSLGPCEHTSQLWKFNLGKNSPKSWVLNFTYHTHPHANPDDVVYGPVCINKVENRVLLPANLKEGPAILEAIENKVELQKIWQGMTNDEVLLTADFVGINGWMITSKGKILSSQDGGITWDYLSQVPNKIVEDISEIKFRNNLEGYLIGNKGMIFHTKDSGKTWDEQNSGASGTLNKISLNNKIVVVTSLEGEVLININGENSWKKLDFEENKKVDDILVQGNSLFLLSSRELYILGF